MIRIPTTVTQRWRTNTSLRRLRSSVAAKHKLMADADVESSFGHTRRGEPRPTLNFTTYPGSRVLALDKAEEGNTLTEDVVHTLQDKLKVYENNYTVGALLLSSTNPEVFSIGLGYDEQHTSTGSPARAEKSVRVADSVNSLVAYLSHYAQNPANPTTIAVFGGFVSGTAFGAFAGARYRLGSTSTRLVIDELLAGQIPIGGLAHRFARCCDGPELGVPMARYLAVSRRRLAAHDLCSLGLLSHLCEEMPEENISLALAQTRPLQDAFTKAKQPVPVLKESIPYILDTMDIDCTDVYNPAVRIDSPEPPQKGATAKAAAAEALGSGATGVGGRLDSHDVAEQRHPESVLRDPMWNDLILVEPQPISRQAFFEGDGFSDPSTLELIDDIEDIAEEVQHCFSADDINECIQRLQACAASAEGGLATPAEGVFRNGGMYAKGVWAVDALAKLQELLTAQPIVLEEWFRLTRFAAQHDLNSVLQKELDLVRKLTQ